MTLSFGTVFPFEAVELTPADLSPASGAINLASPSLRRKMVTQTKDDAQVYTATLTKRGRNVVDFVGIVGCNVRGDATVTLRNNDRDLETLTLTIDDSRRVFVATVRTRNAVDELSVVFPPTTAGGRLECARVVTGRLVELQAEPARVNIFNNLLGFAPTAQGLQDGAAAVGVWRTMRVEWEKLRTGEREEIEEVVLEAGSYATVLVRDGDDWIYGMLGGGLDEGGLNISEERFNMLVNASLTIRETLVV